MLHTESHASAAPVSLAHTWLHGTTRAMWHGQACWVLMEVDSPDAHAFLQLWQQWQESQESLSRPHTLHVIAVLANQAESVGWSASSIAQQYPASHPCHALANELATQLFGLLPGVHRITLHQGHVLLTLWIGDSTQHLRQQHTSVNAIWLHAPRAVTQPQHWLKSLARHCQPGTLLGCTGALPTDFAASLQANGFVAIDVPADSSAGELTHLQYAPRWTPRQRTSLPSWLQPTDATRTALVIGAGLAGSAAAWSLAQRGWHVKVLGMGSMPADGASGLPAGLFCPHISPDDSVLSRLSRSGVRMTLQRLQQLCTTGLDWAPSGVLEHCKDGGTALPTHWPANAGNDWSHPATSVQRELAGLPPNTDACWHQAAGWVRPQQLVQAQLNHPLIDFVPRAKVAQLIRSTESTQSQSSGQEVSPPRWHAVDAQGQHIASADLVVVAAGARSPELLPAPGWPLQPIRGQVTYGTYSKDQALPLPPFPVNGHGNFVPHIPKAHAEQYAWIMGSTFERDVTDLPVSAADQALAHASNLAKLSTLLPETAQTLAPWFDPTHDLCQATWGHVRCASHDRLPVVGPVLTASQTESSEAPGMWVLTALGSRGLTLSVLCGELLAAQIHGEPLPLDAKLASHLGTARMARHSQHQKT